MIEQCTSQGCSAIRYWLKVSSNFSNSLADGFSSFVRLIKLQGGIKLVARTTGHFDQTAGCGLIVYRIGHTKLVARAIGHFDQTSTIPSTIGQSDKRAHTSG